MEKKEKISRNYERKNGVSTRDTILERARELVNQSGVVDLRIEALASSLSLSPGNITYHFPKKDDIILALWHQYQNESEQMSQLVITPLLDIKQLMLMLRSSALNSVKYLGIMAYSYGDVGVLVRMKEAFNAEYRSMCDFLSQVYDVLESNGYMVKIEDEDLRAMTIDFQFTTLRWWYNQAMLQTDYESVSNQIDRYIIQSLYPLLPFLTESGKRQFESIMKIYA